MKLSTLLILLLAVTASVFGQRKVLISSSGDVVALKPGQDAKAIVRDKSVVYQTNSCDVNQTTLGYNTTEYPNNNPFLGYHRDTFGQWFVAPASGTIDTLFIVFQDNNFANNPAEGLEDGQAKIAIWKSNITPTHGPGHGPYNPPRKAWGYYNAVGADDDQHITPFKAVSDDQIWVPTNMDVAGPGVADAVPSFDPLGDNLWPGSPGAGLAIGMGQTVSHDVINAIPLALYADAPVITKDSSFFVTLQCQGSHNETFGGEHSYTTTMAASGKSIPNPPVNWKFYEHSPVSGNFKGWHARGDGTWTWWMVMTVTSDLPPRYLGYSQLLHTLNTGSRTVTAEIEDCNPSNPGQVGVASAKLAYSVNGGAYDTLTMTNTSADNYSATIPGQPAGSYVRYNLVSTDVNGNTATTAENQYSVVALKGSGYYLDTLTTYNWIEIAGDGTNHPSTDFFNTRATNPPQDDGTSNAVALGIPFTFYGDSVHYAWIGINGAMSLTASSSDVQQINGRGGTFTSSWQIPYSISVSQTDTMPKNFVAVFHNDFAIPPAVLPDLKIVHGSIWTKTVGSQFIVEWDSVQDVNHVSDSTITFQAIFDGSDNSITFQYKDVGIFGFDTTALIALDKDDNHFHYIHNQAYPRELQPRNGRALHLTPTFYTTAVANGWDMISVPMTAPDNATTHLFPTASSKAFRYSSGYSSVDNLTPGTGYWLKFGSDQSIDVPGSTFLYNNSVSVAIRWNMIGSVAGPVAVTSINTAPSGIVASPYYGFGGGYAPADTLKPGKGYWVKTSAAGSIIMSSSPSNSPKASIADALVGMSSLTIADSRGMKQTLYLTHDQAISVDAFELPPAAPAGLMDVRYANNGMVAAYGKTDVSTMGIGVRNAVGAVTLSWNLKDSHAKFEVADNAGGKELASKVIAGTGSVRLASLSNGLTIKTTASVNVPREFSMEQNYPNPFNPMTNFSYGLPTASRVTLKVFNVLGQLMATLVDEEQSAGYHTSVWNPANTGSLSFGSGVYFYRLEASSLEGDQHFTRTSKMMYLK